MRRVHLWIATHAQLEPLSRDLEVLLADEEQDAFGASGWGNGGVPTYICKRETCPCVCVCEWGVRDLL